MQSALKISVSLAAIILAQSATTAFAASEAEATVTSIPSATLDDAGIDSGSDIIVTATKRETNLQDTPISIAVMGSEDLKKRNVQSMIDLADGAIPSLRVATFESRQSALTIGMRGIVPGDANQPAREQGVGVYIDGVYLGRQHGLNAALLDVERIEVLKGPQGTLFGRNTEGGAVNIITRAPSGDFGGRVSAGFGNYGSYTGGLHLDLPAVANIAVKLDATLQHQNATTTNPQPGEFGWNYAHRYGGRASARWTPSDTLTADVAFDIGRDENTPYYSQLINYNPNGLRVATLAQITAAGNKLPSGFVAPLPAIAQVRADRMSAADIGVPQQPSIGRTKGISSSLKWEVSDDIELRSITAWRTVSDDQWDNSGGAHRTPVFLPGASFSRYSIATLDQRQFSQELQAVGSLPQIDYVFGLYYFNERANDAARTPNTNKWNSDGTGYSIIDPVTYLQATVARASIAYAKSYAAYGQFTYTPAGFEALHLTGGGRVTRDEKDGRLFIVNGAATNLTFDQKNSRFDPLVTLAYDASDSVNLYAKYATGYRAGGASSRSLTYRDFGPESVKSYELGLKSELFDKTVRFNLAAYMMDRTDSQVDFNFFIPQTNGTVRNTLETVNAIGKTKIRGLEADLSVRPLEGLSFGLSYAYTYWNLPPARNTVQEQLNASLPVPITTPVVQDVYIVYTPKHALSGTFDYDVPLGSAGTRARIHFDGNYSSRAYTFDNEPVKNDPGFIVNGRFSIADIPMSDAGQKLTVAVWGRNLFNEQHIYRRSNANRTVLGDYANFNAPRTIGLEGTITF